MKSKFPKAVKACLWSYRTDKMSLSNPADRQLIIFSTLNYGTEEAIQWTQAHFPEKEIKQVIKKVYASQWFKWSLKRWADYYKVFPKWRTRIEYILRNEKDKAMVAQAVKSAKETWPYGGHNL